MTEPITASELRRLPSVGDFVRFREGGTDLSGRDLTGMSGVVEKVMPSEKYVRLSLTAWPGQTVWAEPRMLDVEQEERAA